VSLWRLAHGAALSFDRTRVLAIINVTPDSFSDGGECVTPRAACDAAIAAIDQGADMLDIGGESTRPGASAVPADEQIHRVVPALRAIRDAGVSAPISVDTTSTAVAQAALDAGANAVNDTSAGLGDPAMLPLVAAQGAGVILMHRPPKEGPPCDNHYSHEYTVEPDYTRTGGVVQAVVSFLRQRIDAALLAGVAPASIVVDPGLGFGKSVQQNFALLSATDAINALGYPVLAAASRKSFLGAVAGVATPRDRVASSVAAAVIQRLGGAAIFRTHDIQQTAEALRIADATMRDNGLR